MIGFGLDELHVADRRADVFRRDVAAAQRLHVAAVRAEDRLAIANLVVADDDALAAAKVQTRDRGLVGHAARQPQAVDQRVAIVGVIPEPRPAARGAEPCIVDGYTAAIPPAAPTRDRRLRALV